MTMHASTDLRNDWLDRILTIVGASPTLKILTGAAPADCAAAETGTVIATMTLPATWLGAAAGGSISKSGTWEDASADNGGTATYYRIYQGATCHLQGSVTISGGGGELELDAVVITAGQTVTITSYTFSFAA